MSADFKHFAPMNTRGLTPRQIYVLNRVAAYKVAGSNVRGRWKWIDVSRGEIFNSQIDALMNRGILCVKYYSGNKAGLAFTDNGQRWFERISHHSLVA